MNSEMQVNKIWLKNIFKSYVWLIFPLTFWGGISSCESYIEAGTHLTEASVSVRGYYRKDGTYVRPYNRRPPGGAKHDKPYESKRLFMGFIFFACLAGGCGSIFYYVSMCKEEANEFISKYEREQERIRLENKRKIIIEFLSTIMFDFVALSNIPHGLTLGGILMNCKFCHSYLYKKDYYISYKAIKHKHYVCLDCLKERSSIGKGQPSKKYSNALNYTQLFDKQFEIFSTMFLNKNKLSGIIFSREEIKKIFIEKIKVNSSSQIN